MWGNGLRRVSETWFEKDGVWRGRGRGKERAGFGDFVGAMDGKDGIGLDHGSWFARQSQYYPMKRVAIIWEV